MLDQLFLSGSRVSRHKLTPLLSGPHYVTYQERIPILRTLPFSNTRAILLTLVAGSLSFRIYVISFLSLRYKGANTHAQAYLNAPPTIFKTFLYYSLWLNSRFSSVLAARGVSSQSFKDPECWSRENDMNKMSEMASQRRL